MARKIAVPENPVVSMLKDERSRSERMLNAFEAEIEKLPKGSLQKKKRGNKEYFYLSYRSEGGKVVSEYVRMEDVERCRSEIKRREHLKNNVKTIRYGIFVLDRALKGE